jgi:hypothetical protein
MVMVGTGARIGRTNSRDSVNGRMLVMGGGTSDRNCHFKQGRDSSIESTWVGGGNRSELDPFRTQTSATLASLFSQFSDDRLGLPIGYIKRRPNKGIE